MPNPNKRYDVVQPFTFKKGEEEVTKWQRVGTAFPRRDKEGNLVGFTLRFTNSPPYPDMVMVSEARPRESRTESAAKQPNLDDIPY